MFITSANVTRLRIFSTHTNTTHTNFAPIRIHACVPFIHRITLQNGMPNAWCLPVIHRLTKFLWKFSYILYFSWISSRSAEINIRSNPFVRQTASGCHVYPNRSHFTKKNLSGPICMWVYAIHWELIKTHETNIEWNVQDFKWVYFPLHHRRTFKVAIKLLSFKSFAFHHFPV